MSADSSDTRRASEADAASSEVDPVEFLRAMLRLSPEDAAKARAEAAEQGTRAKR